MTSQEQETAMLDQPDPSPDESTYEATVKTTCVVDDEFVSCVIEMAGYGLSAWANFATQNEELKQYTIGLREDALDDVKLPLASGNQVTISYKQIVEAYVLMLGSGNWNQQENMERGLLENDGGYVDAEIGDLVMQFAVFGSYVYS